MAQGTNVTVPFGDLAASAYRVHCKVGNLEAPAFLDLGAVQQSQWEAVVRHVSNMLNHDYGSSEVLNFAEFEATFGPNYRPPRLRGGGQS